MTTEAIPAPPITGNVVDLRGSYRQTYSDFNAL